MKKKKLLKLLAGICLVLVLAALPFMAACAEPAPAPAPTPTPTPALTPTPAPTPTPTPAPAKPIVLKFAHQNPPTSRPQVKWIQPWCDKIEEVTNGRVTVDIYHSRSLVSERENYPAVVTGVCDLTWVVLGMYAGRFPYSDVKSLPFLALKSGKVNGETYSAGKINSRIWWELYEELPEMQKEWSEVKLLDLAACAPDNVYTTTKPVHNLEELQGLKLRTLAGGQTLSMKALGATPINMPIAEIYEAAQRGVLDGMVANPSQIQSFRLWDVFRYYTAVGMQSSLNATAMNQHRWDSLPADIQEAIWGISGLWGSEFHGDQVWGFSLDEDVLRESTAAGNAMEMVDLDPGEYERWKEIGGKPVWDNYVTSMEAKGLENGQQAIDILQQLIEKYKP